MWYLRGQQLSYLETLRFFLMELVDDAKPVLSSWKVDEDVASSVGYKSISTASHEAQCIALYCIGKEDIAESCESGSAHRCVKLSSK